MAPATAVDGVRLDAVTGGETAGVRLAGDQAQGTRFGAGAVERALRAGQRFDAFQIVDVQIERALDRGDRLFVEIDADAGQRTGVVAVAAAGDAAHVDLTEARAVRSDRHARQQLGVVLEIVDLQFVELLGTDHVEADRHVLRVLGALLRGDGDRLQRRTAALGVVALLGHRRTGEGHAAEGDVDRRGQRHSREFRLSAGGGTSCVTHCSLPGLRSLDRWNG